MNPIIMEAYGSNVCARLRAQGWTHLQVTKRGQHPKMPMRGADGARRVKQDRSTPYSPSS